MAGSLAMGDRLGLLVARAGCVPLVLGVLRRMGTKVGVVSFSYMYLVLATLGYGGVGMLVSQIDGAMTLPRYEATVTGHSSSVGTSSHDGYTRHTTTPILRFVDAAGTARELPADVSSSDEEEIGERITIGYWPGSMVHAEVFSSGKVILLCGLGVMLLIGGYLLVMVSAYSLGQPMARYLAVGVGGLLYFLLPLGMLSMLWGMAYHGVCLYLIGERDGMSSWAFWVCVVFSAALVLAVIGYVRALLERRHVARGPGAA